MILIRLSFCRRPSERPCVARTAPAPALEQCRSLVPALAAQTGEACWPGIAVGSGAVAIPAWVGHNGDGGFDGGRGLGAGGRLLTTSDSLGGNGDVDGRDRGRRRDSDSERGTLGAIGSTGSTGSIAARSIAATGGRGRWEFGDDDSGSRLGGDRRGGHSLILAAGASD